MRVEIKPRQANHGRLAKIKFASPGIYVFYPHRERLAEEDALLEWALVGQRVARSRHAAQPADADHFGPARQHF